MATQCWWGGRGGAGVIFHNAMDDIPGGKSGISLTVYSINRATNSLPCQTAYPAARQTGQGWSASSKATYGNPVVVTEGVYIWGNTGSETTDPYYVGLDQYAPDDCGNHELVGNFLIQGRDYFVGTAKPNYSLTSIRTRYIPHSRLRVGALPLLRTRHPHRRI
jgi:hypothetical protein